MKYFAAFLLLFFSILSFGQNQQKIDSLQSELVKDIDDRTRLSLLTEIFNNYLFIDLDSAKIYKDKIIKLPIENKKDVIGVFSLSSRYYYYKSQLDSSIYFTEKALDIAKSLNDDKLESDLYRKMAILSSRNSNYESAEKYGKLALRSAYQSRDWQLMASSNIMLGNQYYKKTEFDIALKYYLTSDSIYTLNKQEDRFLANSYDNISSIYTDLKDKKALDYIEKSNNIYKNLKDEEGLAYNHTLKGTYYSIINKHELAIPNYEEAIKFYRNYGDNFRLNDAQSRLINSYSKTGNYKKAVAILTEAEKEIKKSQGEDVFFGLYLNGGQLFLDLKKYNSAIEYFKKADNIIDNNENNFSIGNNREIKKGLTHAYLGKNDYQNALKYSQLQLEITDSINMKNNIEITKELEVKYQSEKKEQEIILLKSQNELAEQQKINQRNQLLGGIGLTTIAGLFFFFLYRNRQKTTQKLQELDKAKSNFFANISHEFRTPLTLISGPIQGQLKKDNLPEEERNNLEMMNRNSSRLLSLVDQLLDISKIEAGSLKLKVSKSEIMPFIGTLCDGFTFRADQKQLNYITYINETQTNTWFDKDIVEKVVINLISNAIKYTPDKGSIVCSATIKNNQLLFTVKNTGDGLTKEEISKIFERFYQINENRQGVGIGLALVKELVTLHKGTISVESDPNEWTTFKAILPLSKNSFATHEIVTKGVAENKQEENQIILENNAVTDSQNDHIIDENNENPILLVVDDNNDIRAYIGNMFKDHYTILKAKDGQEGIELAIENIPDIIISDIMMPVKNGIELCNTLKIDERTSHIPIILLTAKAGEENEIAGIQTGADDYVTKPFYEELLLLKVKKLIESRKKLQLRYSQEVILRPKDIAITSVDEQFLGRLQKVLDTKLIESSFSIEAFSSAVGMSRMQLHRKLKALTGLSATEFVRSQRLKLAAQLLKKSEINVSQVGYSVGFNDHAYFSKCFKELYHCTPSEYAKSAKE